MERPSASSRRIPRRLGEYQIVRLIAQGGMGAVFEVVHTRTGAAYAAKTILKADDPMARARFQREAELLARCDRHPGVVPIHSAGAEPDGTLYLILELVQGEGLDRLLERERRLPARRAAEIGRAIAEALAFVHERGIVHRDVKPSNVLMDSEGRPRLTDFGLATARDVEQLTRTGQFVGTVAYVSPEQAGGKNDLVGPWSDVYAVGALLFHLLAGEPPVTGETFVEVLRRIHDPTPVRDVRDLAPEVPGPLASLVAHALEKDPERRYRTAGELASDLGRFLEGRATRASVESVEGIKRRRARRALAGVGVSLLALGVVGTGWLAARRAQRAGALAAVDATAERVRASLDGATEDPAPLLATVNEARARLATLAQDDARDRTLDVLAAELEAVRELSSGAAPRALARLESAPGAPGSLGLAGRLVHARALVETGRKAEAIRELEALAPLLPATRRADGLEALGDALADPGKAEKAFTTALEAHPHRPGDVRLKRGRAAAQAGDDRTALADLAAIATDLAALPEDRTTNAHLAAFAAPLYRRGLAPGSDASRARDLEAAWRLGPPTAETIPELVRIWGAECARLKALADEQLRVMDGNVEVPRKAWDDARELLGLTRRLRQIEPGRDEAGYWTLLTGFRVWASTRNWEAMKADPIPMVDRLRSVWPDLPTLIFVAGWARHRRRSSILGEGAELLLEAAERLPRATPGEPEEITGLIEAVLEGVLGDDDLDEKTPAIDLDRVLPLFERTAKAPLWAKLATAFGRRARFASAWRCLRRAESCPLDFQADRFDVEEARIEILAAEGEADAAVAEARRFREADPGALGATLLAKALEARGDPDEIARVVIPGEIDEKEGGAARGLACLAEALAALTDPDHTAAGLAPHPRFVPFGSRMWSEQSLAIARQSGVAQAIRWTKGGASELPRDREWWLLGVLARRGAEDASSGALEAILGLVDPEVETESWALYVRGLALCQLGRTAEAGALIGGRLKADPHLAARLAVRLFQRLGRASEGVDLARSELERLGGWRPTLTYVSAIRRRDAPGTAGFVAGREELISRLGASGTAPGGTRAFAVAYAELGRWEDLARIASETAPRDFCHASFLLTSAIDWTAGRVHELAAEGHREEARKLALALASKVKTIPEGSRVLWAKALLQDAGAAELVLDLVDPARTEDEELLVIRGEALADLGRRDEALAFASGIERDFPAAAAALRVGLLLGEGQRQKAVELTRAQPAGTHAATLALRELVGGIVSSGRDLEAIPGLVDRERCRDPRLLGLLGRALIALGRRSEAEALARTLIVRGVAFLPVLRELDALLWPTGVDMRSDLEQSE